MFSSCQEQVGSRQVGHRTAIWAVPQTWLYYHGNSGPWDKSPRDYRQFPSSTGIHGSPHLYEEAGMATAPKAKLQPCLWELWLHPLSAERKQEGQRSPRKRVVT